MRHKVPNTGDGVDICRESVKQHSKQYLEQISKHTCRNRPNGLPIRRSFKSRLDQLLPHMLIRPLTDLRVDKSISQ